MIKLDPKYGVFPWWPQDGNDWLHPEDVAIARRLIPSRRVFRRDGESGPFVILHYGATKLRVLPSLWQEVSFEGFDMGDWVEVVSRGHRNTPRTGRIREMLWEPRSKSLQYLITENGRPVAKMYTRPDLRHVDPTEALADVQVDA